MRLAPIEFVGGGDRIVVIRQLAGKRRGSGLGIDRISAQVATVRDGRITRWEIGYTDPADALEAARLSK